MARSGRQHPCHQLGALRQERGFPADVSLPGAASLAEELADVERAVAYWGGSSAVRERINALAKASASAVLFLEYLLYQLDAWLRERLSSGDEAISAACDMVEQRLRADVGFMNSNELLHFDAHFRNILTDGRRLFFADFGLATSPLFALSRAERVKIFEAASSRYF